MAKRIVVGVAAALLLVLVIWLHGWVLAGVAVLVSLVTQYEIIKTIKTSGVKPVSVVLFGFTASILPVYYFGGLAAVFVAQMFAITLIFVAAILFKSYDFESIFSSVFSLYYPQLFFVFLYMIIFYKGSDGTVDADVSRLILVVTFSCSILTDTFAYFIGTLMGKTPLAPHISPKKTVEGALGGLLGGVLGVEIAAILFDNGRIPLIEYAVFAVVLSMLAQVGDLAASVVKRRYGVKDFGNVFPGHGGMLDRIDSTLFILPIVFIFYTLYL